jgi:hypothetical protein
MKNRNNKKMTEYAMHLNFLKVKKYKLETYSEMIKQSVEN